VFKYLTPALITLFLASRYARFLSSCDAEALGARLYPLSSGAPKMEDAQIKKRHILYGSFIYTIYRQKSGYS
jgi:hypothetical protein